MAFRDVFSKKTESVPDDIRDIVVAGVQILEFANHDVTVQSMGKIKMDPVAKAFFRIGYEFARFGRLPDET